jgi:hypothetical protein
MAGEGLHEGGHRQGYEGVSLKGRKEIKPGGANQVQKRQLALTLRIFYNKNKVFWAVARRRRDEKN